MSAAMRLPSRIGTITLRSMMATSSSSFSVALRAAIASGVGPPRCCATEATNPPASNRNTPHLSGHRVYKNSTFIRALHFTL